MQNKIYRILLCLFGAAFGTALLLLVFRALQLLEIVDLHAVLPGWAMLAVLAAAAIIAGSIFFAVSPKIIAFLTRVKARLEQTLRTMPITDVIVGVFGLVVSLLIAYLITTAFRGVITIPWLELAVSCVIYLILADLGWTVAVKRRGEIGALILRRKGREAEGQKAVEHKILDTNVLIDGRIFDICKTGFIEGTLVIPGFVLRELQHIADSADALKRNKGRRGLDILNRIQKELDIPVVIDERDYENALEVDNKLLKLAVDLKGIIVTNDYNLNKVADVHNIRVLNINDLANAVKPVLAAGEELSLLVVKEGKEAGQGVGYLDDGTMIVIEGGRAYVGKEAQVTVTSILQTSAGRMIFAKVIEEKELSRGQTG